LNTFFKGQVQRIVAPAFLQNNHYEMPKIVLYPIAFHRSLTLRRVDAGLHRISYSAPHLPLNTTSLTPPLLAPGYLLPLIFKVISNLVLLVRCSFQFHFGYPLPQMLFSQIPLAIANGRSHESAKALTTFEKLLLTIWVYKAGYHLFRLPISNIQTFYLSQIKMLDWITLFLCSFLNCKDLVI
jgi:hypothetical protein